MTEQRHRNQLLDARSALSEPYSTTDLGGRLCRRWSHNMVPGWSRADDESWTVETDHHEIIKLMVGAKSIAA